MAKNKTETPAPLFIHMSGLRMRQLLSTAGLYGFKNATNRQKSKIIHSQIIRRPHGKSINSSAEAGF
jgi:hypothetical protein